MTDLEIFPRHEFIRQNRHQLKRIIDVILDGLFGRSERMATRSLLLFLLLLLVPHRKLNLVLGRRADGANDDRCVGERRNDLGGLLYADTMTYDDVGNRTLLHNAAGRTTYTYDDANQLETAVLNTTRTTYTYDSNGNLQVELTGTSRTTNTWDDENRLTQVEFPGGSPTTNQYTFNGDGQRVQIVDSQGTKKPIWDFENILLETDGSNVTQVVYTLEPVVYGNLISQRRGSTTSFYLFDALGSTRKLTSSAGTVSDTYDFRTYGETFASSGSTVNVFRWIGELGYYYDVDRIAYYLRARAYSPKIARFLTRDGFSLVRRTLKHYVYCSDHPLLITDPSGMIDSIFNELENPLLEVPPSTCADAMRILLRQGHRLPPLIQQALDCGTYIFCGNCKYGDVGYAFITNGRAMICLPSHIRINIRYWEALLLHESVHVDQELRRNNCMCLNTKYKGPAKPNIPPLNRKPCSQCEDDERAAYKAQAQHLFPTDANLQKRFVEAGLCVSCHYCAPHQGTRCPPFPTREEWPE